MLDTRSENNNLWWPYFMADIYAAPILGPTQIYVGLMLWLTFMQPQCWTHVVKIIISGGLILWLTYMQPQCWAHVLKIIICNTNENGYSEAIPYELYVFLNSGHIY